MREHCICISTVIKDLGLSWFSPRLSPHLDLVLTQFRLGFVLLSENPGGERRLARLLWLQSIKGKTQSIMGIDPKEKLVKRALI